MLRVARPATLQEADVLLRKAIEHARTGAGASAVVDAQSAVVAYVGWARWERLDAAYLGLARSLMEASAILAVYADAEVALAAAREGLSWAVAAVNSGYPPDEPTGSAMVLALRTEVALLEALGRPHETGNARGALAHFGVTDDPAPLDSLPGLAITDGGVAGAVRMLRLLRGVDGDLGQLLLDHPVGPLCVPAFRCPPEWVRTAATACTQAALVLLASDVPAGLRLGLEAHYLHAFAVEEQLPVPAELDDVILVSWCRLLGVLADRFDRAGVRELARDLASWGTDVLMIISPQFDGPAVGALGDAVRVFDRLGS